MKKNLSVAQQLGLKSLARKVSKMELIVLEADKGKSFVVTDEATYLDMARDHIAGDKECGPADVRKSERILATTAKAIGNAMNLGTKHSQGAYVRCLDNLGSEAGDVPTLKLLVKVHKPLGPDGHPQSRPVVAAASGLSSRAGDVVADILEPMVRAQVPRMEDQSTEEVLAQLEEAEIFIRDSGINDAMVGSLDVQALYPSLDQLGSSKAVEDFIMQSKVEMIGVDYRAVQVYLASNLSEQEVKDEGLVGLVPARLAKMGPRPGKTTTELRQKKKVLDKGKEEEETAQQDSKWAPTNLEQLTEEQKMILVSKMLRLAVLNIFRNHMYQFGGVTFRQLKGAPIGLRLTSIIARIVMDQWLLKFLAILDQAGVEVYMAAKYVDDVNVVMSMLGLGSRWDGSEVVWSQEQEETDRTQSRTREEVTMEVTRDIADSIIPWLKFTMDLPQYHDNGMVPILDLQVWVQHPSQEEMESGLGSDLLMWIFYEKDTASEHVFMADSAYTWRSKITTLSMEAFRRMRNTSRQASLTTRSSILKTFIRKVRGSGYSLKSCIGILESGLRHYYRKLQVDLEGGPKLNLRCDSDAAQKRRTKIGASHNWFSRRRGGADEKWKKENHWRNQDCADNQATEGARRRVEWGRVPATATIHGHPPLLPTKTPTTTTTTHANCGVEWGCVPASATIHGRPPLLPTTTPATKDTRRRVEWGRVPATATIHGTPLLLTAKKQEERKIVSTLLVPYTMGSGLQKTVQASEDKFSTMTGGYRIRVVEKGGEKLAHLLCRNDPWAAQRVCPDKECVTCLSKVWLREQKKAARKSGQKLPEVLLKSTSNQCRRESLTYTLQCLDCAILGRGSFYQGESSQSARQRQGKHSRDLAQGVAASPLVEHTVRVHGGVRPQVLYMIKAVEPKPLYRAVRESVAISLQPGGDANLNRCQEWGAPRVPILTAQGGDKGQECGDREDRVGPNPNLRWAKMILEEVEMGVRKRVKLWDSREQMELEMSGSGPTTTEEGPRGPPASKRRRAAGPSPPTLAASNTADRLTSAADKAAVETAALKAAGPLTAILEAARPEVKEQAAQDPIGSVGGARTTATSATTLAATPPAARLTNTANGAAVSTAAPKAVGPLTAGGEAASVGTEVEAVHPLGPEVKENDDNKLHGPGGDDDGRVFVFGGSDIREKRKLEAAQQWGDLMRKPPTPRPNPRGRPKGSRSTKVKVAPRTTPTTNPGSESVLTWLGGSRINGGDGGGEERENAGRASHWIAWARTTNPVAKANQGNVKALSQLQRLDKVMIECQIQCWKEPEEGVEGETEI